MGALYLASKVECEDMARHEGHRLEVAVEPDPDEPAVVCLTCDEVVVSLKRED